MAILVINDIRRTFDDEPLCARGTRTARNLPDRRHEMPAPAPRTR
jgi:hypothetical protein